MRVILISNCTESQSSSFSSPPCPCRGSSITSKCSRLAIGKKRAPSKVSRIYDCLLCILWLERALVYNNMIRHLSRDPTVRIGLNLSGDTKTISRNNRIYLFILNFQNIDSRYITALSISAYSSIAIVYATHGIHTHSSFGPRHSFTLFVPLFLCISFSLVFVCALLRRQTFKCNQTQSAHKVQT